MREKMRYFFWVSWGQLWVYVNLSRNQYWGDNFINNWSMNLSPLTPDLRDAILSFYSERPIAPAEIALDVLTVVCGVLLWPLSRWGGCQCKELKHMWPYFCDWSVSTTIYCFICPELVTVCTGTFRSPYQISLVGNFTTLPDLISFSEINSQSKARSCIFTILMPDYTSIKYNK